MMNAIVILCDTLRRDHCGPYHHGRLFNEVGGADQPNWVVPTPNLDRLARMGTVFDHCYAGSTPCMPVDRPLNGPGLHFGHKIVEVEMIGRAPPGPPRLVDGDMVGAVRLSNAAKLPNA